MTPDLGAYFRRVGCAGPHEKGAPPSDGEDRDDHASAGIEEDHFIADPDIIVAAQLRRHLDDIDRKLMVFHVFGKFCAHLDREIRLGNALQSLFTERLADLGTDFLRDLIGLACGPQRVGFL
jgi:hypothetical protein